MAMKLLICGLTLLCLRSSYAYNSGAPEHACNEMMPGHTPFQAQVGTAPYVLNAVQSGTPGEIIVELTSREQRPFKGFLIKAFRPGLNGDVRQLGEFINFDDHANKVECPLQQAITHWNAQPKTTLRFTWKARENGPVQFRATVVEAYDTFYTNVISSVINL